MDRNFLLPLLPLFDLSMPSIPLVILRHLKTDCLRREMMVNHINYLLLQIVGQDWILKCLCLELIHSLNTNKICVVINDLLTLKLKTSFCPFRTLKGVIDNMKGSVPMRATIKVPTAFAQQVNVENITAQNGNKKDCHARVWYLSYKWARATGIGSLEW